MSIVDICPTCGAVNEPNVAFCGACAAPLHAPLAERKSALPAKWSPPPSAVALGATVLTLRVGQWLVKRAWDTWLARRETRTSAAIQPTSQSAEAPLKATLRIRRRWAWGDQNGLREWGEEDIIIE